MKLSTINQIVEAILAEYKGKDEQEAYCAVANEATIYLKTALICEDNGIEKAMEYFKGWHSQVEYRDFLTGVISPKEINERY